MRSSRLSPKEILPVFLILILTLATSASAAEPLAFQLRGRSNIYDGYQLPDRSSFTQATAIINDAGTVAATLLAIDGKLSSGLWLSDGTNGRIVHETHTEEILLGSHTLLNDGSAVFSRIFGNGIAEGIFGFNPVTGLTTKLVSGGLSTEYAGFSFPFRFTDGAIAFRATGWNGARSFVTVRDGVAQVLAHETSADSSSPYSFLFVPAMNEAGWIAAKTLQADGSTSLVEWRPGEVSPQTIPLGTLEGLDNGIALTPVDGSIAFIGHLRGGDEGVFFWNGVRLVEIASTRNPRGVEAPAQIEGFAPAVNANGIVIFRARGVDGLQAIYAGDGKDLIRVVAEHDVLPSDLGPARIDQNDKTDPVFAGGVSINASNVIAFRAALTPPEDDQKEWGEGIYTVQIDGLGQISSHSQKGPL